MPVFWWKGLKNTVLHTSDKYFTDIILGGKDEEGGQKEKIYSIKWQ